MNPTFRVFTHEEQRKLAAAGLREMVDAEGRSEDDDGVCRQPMVWLRKTGQKALPARRTYSGAWPMEATDALAKAGYLFPVPRNSGLYLEPCCDTAWLPVDDLDADELFCCKEQSFDLWAIAPDAPVVNQEVAHE